MRGVNDFAIHTNNASLRDSYCPLWDEINTDFMRLP